MAIGAGQKPIKNKKFVKSLISRTFWHAVRDSPPGLLVRRVSGSENGIISAPFCGFVSVHSENIPLFPSGTACSIRILGQKWVRSKCVALQTGSYLSQFVNADGGQAAYLADIDRQTQERFERLIEDMKLAQVITERLKAENAMEWTRRMNTILACAMEIFALLS